MSNNLPVIAFTLGDPGGNGPEIVLRTLDYFSSSYPFIPVVFGSEVIFDHPFIVPYIKNKKLKPFTSDANFESNVMYFHNSYEMTNLVVKKPNKMNGEASYSYIVSAVKFIQEGLIDALVTAPICKESFDLAKLPFTGHTTLLKKLTNVEDVSMGFHTSKYDVVLATIHVPLKDVSSLITKELLKKKIHHLIDFQKQIGKTNIRIGVAGLNPHAGENGMFGMEEKLIIKPFIESENFGPNVTVSGPYSPDTLFYRASNGEFDCVLALYHDQGLIAVKLNSFHEAVNTTIGLPFVRTSPDHGTGFDRAYEQLSSIDSLLAATRLAIRMIN